MQTQFLSNKEVDPSKPSQKSIVLPTINQKPSAEMSYSEVPSPKDIQSQSRSSKGYMTSQNRQHSQRNTIANAPITGRSKKNLLQGKS